MMSDWNDYHQQVDHQQFRPAQHGENGGNGNGNGNIMSYQQDFGDIFLGDFISEGQLTTAPIYGQGTETGQFDFQQPQHPQHPQHQNLDVVNQQIPGVSPNDIFTSSPLINGNNFTPLLSPATAPVEGYGRAGEFAMPSAFFSPTSSPLIEPNSSYPNHHRRPSTSSTKWKSNQNTPIMAAQQTGGRVSKPAKKRKTPAQFEEAPSSADSVSPEELPDIAMPPPQRTNPTNNNNNNNNSSSNQSIRKASTSSTSTISQADSAPGTPATPASLMNLPPGEKNQSSTDERLANAIRATTLTTTTKKPVPIRQRSASTSQSSPHLAALRSKQSTARISPNIKPKTPSTSPHILPQQNHQSDYSALLASKSNYQNIVEGNHSQLGLSYPEQLSVDLTSKKTSHKIAEQGRRNRINVALQELGDLVANKGGGQVQSKASTVENAITYIQELQKELKEVKDKLASLESS